MMAKFPARMDIWGSLVVIALIIIVALIFPPFFNKYPEYQVELHVKPKPPPGIVVSYWEDIQPILDSRCVVCHACYDAPCQLKLSSYEGILRGASKEPVYNASRLTPMDPTRLFIDASTPSEWRRKGFFSVQ